MTRIFLINKSIGERCVKMSEYIAKMDECVNKPMLPEFSGCLVEKPSCEFAVRFGFSYLCEHPKHKDFNNVPSGRNLNHNKL